MTMTEPSAAVTGQRPPSPQPSHHTLDKATKAKMKLESYYSNLLLQHIERKQR